MANQPPFAEYPRPSGSSVGYSGRGPGVYFDAISESWGIVRQDLGTWVAATLLTMLMTFIVILPALPTYIGGMLSMQGRREPDLGALGGLLFGEVALVVLATVAQQFFLAGMVGLAVHKLRGEAIDVKMLFAPFRSFGRVLGASLLFFVIYMLSCLACGLPALYFGPVLILMTSVAFLQGLGPMESLSITYQACKAHWGGLLGLSIVMYLIVTISVYVCFIPVLFTVPMAAVVFGIHYRAFFESYAPVYGVPPIAPA